MIQGITSIFQLAKIPLCLLIWCSTMFGFALSQNRSWFSMILTGFGVFLLAAGGAAMNSIQDRLLDGRMQRTRNRPMVKARISKEYALVFAVLLIACGLAVIFTVSQSIAVMLLGAFALFLYNGVYTPLKKSSLWAIVPGALCGAMPPYIGWLSAGGAVVGFIPGLFFSLFFLWQIPHFWLVLLNHKKDYLSTELPNLLHVLEEERLKRFFITWIGALVTTMLMFLTLFPYSFVWLLIIVLNSSGLLLVFFYLLFTGRGTNYRLLFILLNSAIFIHMVVVAAGMKF